MIPKGPESTENEKLVCIDFDQTIVNGHFHAHFSNKGVTPLVAENGIQVKDANGNFALITQPDVVASKGTGAPPEQIAALLDNQIPDDFDPQKKQITGPKHGTQMCAAIRNALQNGTRVAITSFTKYPEVIEPTLEKIGLTKDEIAKIYIVGGFPSHGKPDGSPNGKQEHIEQAMKHFGITDPKNVMVVDDTENNLKKAEEKQSIPKENLVSVPKDINPENKSYFAKIAAFSNTAPILSSQKQSTTMKSIIQPEKQSTLLLNPSQMLETYQKPLEKFQSVITQKTKLLRTDEQYVPNILNALIAMRDNKTFKPEVKSGGMSAIKELPDSPLKALEALLVNEYFQKHFKEMINHYCEGDPELKQQLNSFLTDAQNYIKKNNVVSPEKDAKKEKEKEKDKPISTTPNAVLTPTTFEEAQTQNFNDVQTKKEGSESELELLFSHHTPVITPMANTGSTPKNVLGITQASAKEILASLQDNDNKLQKDLKIKVTPDNKDNPSELKVELEPANKDSKPLQYSIKNQASGGVNYSLKSGMTETQAKEVVDNMCRLAVETAKPGTEFNIPPSPHKEYAEKQIQHYLKEAIENKKFSPEKGFTEDKIPKLKGSEPPSDKKKVTANV